MKFNYKFQYKNVEVRIMKHKIWHDFKQIVELK